MRHNRGVVVLAHIGNIPVEEWLPFVVPVVVLYLVGRRMTRARERDVARVMAEERLDEPTVEEILERWRRRRPNELSVEHVPDLLPARAGGIDRGASSPSGWAPTLAEPPSCSWTS